MLYVSLLYFSIVLRSRNGTSSLATKGRINFVFSSLFTAASECKTVARDLWTRGYDRWMVRSPSDNFTRVPHSSPLHLQIIPTVRTTYDLSSYLHPQLVSLSALLRPSASSLSLSSSTTLSSPLSPTDERIDWSALSPPTSVVCFEWARGWHIDLEWWRATLELPYAGAVAVSRRWSR